jgi:hypothetical protein
MTHTEERRVQLLNSLQHAIMVANVHRFDPTVSAAEKLLIDNLRNAMLQAHFGLSELHEDSLE